MAIFGLNCNPNTQRAETAPTALKIISWGERTGNPVKLTEAAGELLRKPELVLTDAELLKQISVIVSLGGDGTILNTARLVSGSQIPILGVNTGTLGFLTETPLSDLDEDLERVAAGEYRLDERMTLETKFNGQALPPALNEVVIDRGSISRIINIDLFADDEPVATYQADGLVIATPTGSTAYSLSVGGPILAPSMRAIIAAPISAFGFNGRPFVFSEHTRLEVRVFSAHGESRLTVDGQFTVDLPENGEFQVRVCQKPVSLIRFHDSSFYQVLRSKLNWGSPPPFQRGE